jgi:hypothetical protein
VLHHRRYVAGAIFGNAGAPSEGGAADSLCVTFIGLYGLYIRREVIAMRQRSK